MAGAEKMSKSLGNVVTVADLLAQGHKGEVLRLALLSAPLPPAAGMERAAYRAEQGDARSAVSSRLAMAEDPSRCPAETLFVEALSDDLNTPLALSSIYRLPIAEIVEQLN